MKGLLDQLIESDVELEHYARAARIAVTGEALPLVFGQGVRAHVYGRSPSGLFGSLVANSGNVATWWARNVSFRLTRFCLRRAG